MTGRDMSEEMAAEFDTLADWTGDAAVALGPDYYVPAGCRGSGRPAALDWLLDRMAARPGDRLVDIGAGVGGPAGYAAQRASVRPVLLEPAAGACRAARRLFGLPVARADALALPLPDAFTPLAWSLGVLCTTGDHLGLLGELRRVLRPDGRGGLLVFVSEQPLSEQPSGNDFPTQASLAAALAAAGLTVVEQTAADATAAEPADWQDRVSAVDDELARRHRDDTAWQIAEQQSETMGRLLSTGEVAGHLLVVRPSADLP
ncbi:class I SAM-dependent methyltransferase [uncultured Jatrophihabitans sp.]|uniref:class I SAM-dependent methyltransferase n=1 Tax=uncultured Jatrophihabitans sp. TaxID=1610747 RepID=UPI0035CB2E01